MDNEKEWVGDHLIDRDHVPGIIITSFGINKKYPSLMDIAPTILSLLDQDVPKDKEGGDIRLHEK